MDHNVSFHMHMRVPLGFSVTLLSLSSLRLTISWLKMKDYVIVLILFQGSLATLEVAVLFLTNMNLSLSHLMSPGV